MRWYVNSTHNNCPASLLVRSTAAAQHHALSPTQRCETVPVDAGGYLYKSSDKEDEELVDACQEDITERKAAVLLHRPNNP